MATPKNLKWLTLSMIYPFNSMLPPSMCGFFIQNNIYFVFLTLSDNLLTFIHSDNFDNSLFITVIRLGMFLPVMKTLVSSAKTMVNYTEEALAKSFT